MVNDVGQELFTSKPELEKLNSLWKTIDDIDWLRQYYASNLRALTLQEAREHPYMALSRLGTEKIEREVKTGHFIIATGSPEKLRLIEEVISEQGFVAEPISFVDEESAKEFARESIRGFGKEVYPLAVAAGKFLPFKSQALESGRTIITADSVVVAPDGVILEKPKDNDDLAKMLRLARGRNIKVVVGVNALIPIKYGMVLLRLDEGVVVETKIRDLTDEEIDDYIKKNSKQVMTVAGGIDFSSESGQALIDRNLPIQIRPLKQTIYGVWDKVKAHKRKSVSIDPQKVRILSDYFKGVPKGIVAVLMRQTKELQENVQRL